MQLINRIQVFFKEYRLETVNFFVGAVILTFELAAARVVAPYIGTTIYTWTSIIGVILAALAIGYALGGYLADKRKKIDDIVLLLSLAAASMIVINFVKDPWLEWIGSTGLPLQIQALFGSLILFALPTLILGMVPPYLTRLSISKVSTSGRRVARINAAGTAGSLFGTFITGYLLFGFVGTRHIISLLAICLIGTSFLLTSRNFLAHRLLILLAAILALFAPPTVRLYGVVSDLDTKYSRVLIRDSYYSGRPVRIYQTDAQGWQSGVGRDNAPGFAFPYIQAFDETRQLMPDAKNYLAIGGGALTFPSQLAKQNPTSKVEVIEIDDELPKISRQYFGLEQPSNLSIKISDGRQFLNTNSNKYDMIYIDVFSGTVPPFQLFTTEVTQLVREALSPGGVVVVNIISAQAGPAAGVVEAVAATYRQAFGYVSIFQADSSYASAARQNLILVASGQSLGSKITTAKTKLAADNLFSRQVDVYRDGIVLTDDFAPVERLVNDSM